MPLPKNPEARKRIARAVVALFKMLPEKRKEVISEEMRRRGLEVPAHLLTKE